MHEIYPLTIIADRYCDTYSGGKFTAWNMDYYEIPTEPAEDDVTCMRFWGKTKIPVGRGETPQEAVEDLKRRLEALKMASHKYKIREICGDWALDIHWGNRTIVLYFNSRNNAELVKSILEWEDAHPNEPEYREYTCPNCHHTWLEDRDASDYPEYCPGCGDLLHKEENEPLTLEQLRKMDGEPAWWDDGDGSCWGIISVYGAGMWGGMPFFRGRWREVSFEYNIEERKMKIYRHPPEGGEGDADTRTYQRASWCRPISRKGISYGRECT